MASCISSFLGFLESIFSGALFFCLSFLSGFGVSDFGIFVSDGGAFSASTFIFAERAAGISAVSFLGLDLCGGVGGFAEDSTFALDFSTAALGFFLLAATAATAGAGVECFLPFLGEGGGEGDGVGDRRLRDLELFLFGEGDRDFFEFFLTSTSISISTESRSLLDDLLRFRFLCLSLSRSRDFDLFLTGDFERDLDLFLTGDFERDLDFFRDLDFPTFISTETDRLSLLEELLLCLDLLRLRDLDLDFARLFDLSRFFLGLLDRDFPTFMSTSMLLDLDRDFLSLDLSLDLLLFLLELDERFLCFVFSFDLLLFRSLDLPRDLSFLFRLELDDRDLLRLFFLFRLRDRRSFFIFTSTSLLEDLLLLLFRDLDLDDDLDLEANAFFFFRLFDRDLERFRERDRLLLRPLESDLDFLVTTATSTRFLCLEFDRVFLERDRLRDR